MAFSQFSLTGKNLKKLTSILKTIVLGYLVTVCKRPTAIER